MAFTRVALASLVFVACGGEIAPAPPSLESKCDSIRLRDITCANVRTWSSVVEALVDECRRGVPPGGVELMQCPNAAVSFGTPSTTTFFYDKKGDLVGIEEFGDIGPTVEKTGQVPNGIDPCAVTCPVCAWSEYGCPGDMDLFLEDACHKDDQAIARVQAIAPSCVDCACEHCYAGALYDGPEGPNALARCMAEACQCVAP